MRKYLFNRDTLLATLLVFVLMALLALVPLNTHILDPVKLALKDFDYNDLAYLRMGKAKNATVDTSIIVVNIGNADRNGIAELVKQVELQQPAVIGLDVVFENEKSPAEDSLLVQTIRASPKIVLGYFLQTEHHDMHPKGFLFNKVTGKGFTNFVGEEGGVIRDFSPMVSSGDHHYESFAAAIVAKVNPSKYKGLLERKNKTETINYSHGEDKYVVLDAASLSDSTSPVSLKDKIVLVGFIPDNATDVEDKHFTPMNARSFGKSIPDMHGVLIHANIIHMILSESYTRKMPTWLTWLLAFILCWIHMAVFIHYFLERALWFHIISKIAQLVSAIVFIYLGLLLFYKYGFKINLAPSFVAILLAVDVLYFYDAICIWLHKKYGVKSVFSEHHKH